LIPQDFDDTLFMVLIWHISTVTQTVMEGLAKLEQCWKALHLGFGRGQYHLVSYHNHIIIISVWDSLTSC